jgi:hypothetical protein
MKKILSVCLFFLIGNPIALAISVSPSLGSVNADTKATEVYTPPVYPEGEAFVKLKNLIDTTFIPQTQRTYYGQKCISSGWLCANYKYTSLTEKAIKLIVLDTYSGNEEFYTNLFSSYNGYSYNQSQSVQKTANEIIKTVPTGTPVITDISQVFSPNTSSLFGTNYGDTLIGSSFGIDYTENSSSNSLLGALEQKIQDLKRRKCQKEYNVSSDFDSACPWNGDISNRYLPTEDELYVETIYLNRGPVKVKDVKDEFEYTVEVIKVIDASSPTDRIQTDDGTRSILEIYFDGAKMSESQDITKTDAQNSCNGNKNANPDKYIMCTWDGKILSIENVIQNSEPLTEKKYTLKYKKDSYTLEEAKAELGKWSSIATSNVFLEGVGSLPCQDLWSYASRSQCAAATANARSISNSIWAYYADNEKYPDTIDALNRNYVPRPEVLTEFKKNFEYRLSTGSTFPSYEFVYIGKIGEGAVGQSDKKDYVALLSGATVPEIPGVFAHAPTDSMALYIKNPQNLFALLNIKSNTSTRLSGIDVSDTIKDMMKNFFELKDFSALEKNLKHDVLLIVDNLDLTAPDVTMIISESDRDALAPSANARVVGSKDGYIYISNSKASIDRYMNLAKEKSMAEAPDFRYVWAKKSTLIQDAYMFVWDAFFEKMLTLETYITHYRKYRDVSRLGLYQELVWAYADAYGKDPDSIDTLLTKIWQDGKTPPNTQNLSIKDGMVSDKNIGNLRAIKTLPEVDYDLSKITRSELEDYKINILKYRDVWRASLDPMGIVMNRYGDGMEIDFVMTPIPHLDAEFESMRALFEGTSKDSLSFLSNPKIRMGLLSFIVGLDIKKLEGKIAAIPELQSSVQEINTELLDGKNIFEFLAWEWAFSVGSIPADILDGWNVEKIDAYLSLQFQSQEKWKELIDIIRKKLLADLGDRPSWGYLDMKSFLAKPLIEDYEGKQIFYVEAIPLPFVGKIGFAYTFIDDFFFIGLNRTTMKRVIDTAKTGDPHKKDITDSQTSPKWSFFLALFDGKTASVDLEALYEKNRTSIPRYASLLDKQIMSGSDPLTPVVSAYYVSSLKTRKLGKVTTSLSYTLGALSLREEDDTISVYLDEAAHKTLSGTSLQIWQNIFTDERFPKGLVEKSGMPIAEFLKNPMKSEILSLGLIMQLDRAFSGTESLLRNTTFAVNMWDNEIGFTSRIFREKSTSSTQDSATSSMGNQKYLLWGWIGLILLSLLIGWGYLAFRRRKTSAEPTPGPTPPPTTTWMGNSVTPVWAATPTTPLTTTEIVSTPAAPITLSPSVAISTTQSTVVSPPPVTVAPPVTPPVPPVPPPAPTTPPPPLS